MPSRLKRCYGAGDLHFITASCYRRQPLLGTVPRRNLFLHVLEQVHQRYQFVVVGYVVMPEHFHLLISEPEKANPSVVIQALKLCVARRIIAAQKRRERRSSQSGLREDSAPARIWQARFYDFNVWSGRKEIEKLRYIHRNPIRRGLVETPDQWRWSSFRAYAYGEPGIVRVNDWTVFEDEDSHPGFVKPTVPAFVVPMSQKPRDMGHPFQKCSPKPGAPGLHPKVKIPTLSQKAREGWGNPVWETHSEPWATPFQE